MKGISIKFTHSELQAFNLMLWNLSAMLLQSKDNLDRLCGLMLNESHHRMNRKLRFIFTKPKTVSLNLKECLVLHTYLNALDVPEPYSDAVRIFVFAAIDKTLV